jgi:hypothetical protein
VVLEVAVQLLVQASTVLVLVRRVRVMRVEQVQRTTPHTETVAVAVEQVRLVKALQETLSLPQVVQDGHHQLLGLQ